MSASVGGLQAASDARIRALQALLDIDRAEAVARVEEFNRKAREKQVDVLFFPVWWKSNSGGSGGTPAPAHVYPS